MINAAQFRLAAQVVVTLTGIVGGIVWAGSTRDNWRNIGCMCFVAACGGSIVTSVADWMVP